MLEAFVINSYCTQHMVLAIDHPVEVNNQQLLTHQAPLIQFLQFLGALLDELAAHT